MLSVIPVSLGKMKCFDLASLDNRSHLYLVARERFQTSDQHPGLIERPDRSPRLLDVHVRRWIQRHASFDFVIGLVRDLREIAEHKEVSFGHVLPQYYRFTDI